MHSENFGKGASVRSMYMQRFGQRVKRLARVYLAPLPAKSLAGSEEPGFRGYKVRADGSKTTYFNNDLDDEAKALIGDIRPKRVDNAGVEEAAAGAAGKIAGSSWNVAGTWESRNMTEWGRGRLTELHLY